MGLKAGWYNYIKSIFIVDGRGQLKGLSVLVGIIFMATLIVAVLEGVMLANISNAKL